MVKSRKDTRGHTPINAKIPAPRPPGPWVNEEVNLVTGERFEDFHPNIRFADARARVAAANGERFDASRGLTGGKGYLSRGPVLWMMHVMKLERWYEKAATDGYAWDKKCGRPVESKLSREYAKRTREDVGEGRIKPGRAHRKGTRKGTFRRGRFVDLGDVPF